MSEINENLNKGEQSFDDIEILTSQNSESDDENSSIVINEIDSENPNVSNNGIDGEKVSNLADEKDIEIADINTDLTTSLSEKVNEIDEKTVGEFVNEISTEKIQEALKRQNPKNRRRSIILSVVLLFVNLFFMYFIVKSLFAELDGDIFYAFKSQGSKLWWLLVGVIAYVIFMWLQTCEYKLLISNLSTLDNKKAWKVAYDVAIIGRYYDNLTPLSVGGEPMQIVALSKEKEGVSPAVATGVPVIKMLVNTVITAVLAVVFFVFGLPQIIESTALNQILIFLLEILGVIGVLVTSLSALFMFFLSTGTFFTRSFISGVLRFLYKIKIVKNYRKTYRKTLNQVAEYKFSMKYLMSHKKIFFKLVFMCIVDNVIYSLFPCIVVLAFSKDLGVSPLFFIFISMVKFHLCQMASCFIPLPGGTGLMEISFIILFGLDVGKNIVWALLVWRFLSYYLILINGFIHELIKIFKNISKHKNQTKVNN